MQKAGLIDAGWQQKLPQNSVPYASTIVFLVRHGNPKQIKDWDDLIKDGVKVITPNPKTSGGARWNFLAAWGYAARLPGRDLTNATEAAAAEKAGKENKTGPNTADTRAREYITKLFKNVPVLDTGARGATLSFTQKGVGDVLIAWENEAYLAQDETPGKYDIVYPSVSILAEPPVAIVDKNVDAHGTRVAAEAYLKFLYNAGRAGDRRREPLPPARRGDPGQTRGRPAADQAVHHRRGLRRLGEGPTRVLR